MPTNRAFSGQDGVAKPATTTEMPRSHRAALIVVLIVGACSGSKVHSHPVDAPVDRQTDLPVDSPTDAGADLPADSVADAGADTQADAAGTDTSDADAGAADAGSDARTCLADPTAASSCAPTYAAQVQAGAGRCAGSNRGRAGRCGRYLVYSEPFFASPGTTCYYDPTTMAFVAYRNCSDTPGLDGCFCKYWGEAIATADDCPSLGIGTPDERQSVCSADGGTTSDARVD
jgi:hypothetical protein